MSAPTYLLGTTEQVAALLAWGLGIRIFINKSGKISQHGPGKAILPPPTAKPIYYENQQASTKETSPTT